MIKKQVMPQYIDKSALVAEIKKRLKHNGARAELDRSAFMAGREKEDEDILALLDTLEVKEVHDNLSDSILYGFTEKRKEDDIEYTRTDAFIEKACSWLQENKDKYLYNTGKWDEYIPTCSGKIIEDFRKYMEGE